MAIYSVHSCVGAGDDPVFIKEGFSWPGFFFSLIWLLAKRMWIAAAMAAAFLLAAPLAASVSGNDTFWQSLFGLILSLILGFEGNELRRWALAGRGFEEVDLIEAIDLEAAELKYFAGRPAASPPAPSTDERIVARASHAVDVLGLFGPADGKP